MMEYLVYAVTGIGMIVWAVKMNNRLPKYVEDRVKHLEERGVLPL